MATNDEDLRAFRNSADKMPLSTVLEFQTITVCLQSKNFVQLWVHARVSKVRTRRGR